MPKQKQAVETNSARKSQSRLRLPLAGELADEVVGQTHLSNGAVDVIGNRLIEAQAVQLHDPRIQAIQRQTLAAEIGRRQGNQYLQKVFAAAMPHEKRTSTPVAHQKFAPNRHSSPQTIIQPKPT
jgi:hypothetical protein